SASCARTALDERARPTYFARRQYPRETLEDIYRRLRFSGEYPRECFHQCEISQLLCPSPAQYNQYSRVYPRHNIRARDCEISSTYTRGQSWQTGYRQTERRRNYGCTNAVSVARPPHDYHR